MSYIYFSHDKVKNMRKYCRIHAHRNHELYYLVEGKTKYVVGDEIFNVGEGDVVFVPKGILHMTDSEECMRNERFLLSFDDALFDEETSCLFDNLLSRRLLHIPANRREELENILLSIEKHYGSNDPLKKAAVKLYVLELIAYVSLYSTEAVVKISESDRIVYGISEYINLHYREELSLESLSRIFSVSESHLSRKFKSVAGVGITEYITCVRIMNAERILRSEECSITDVASKCGFNDSNYFSAVFKRIKGITPLKFAKLASEKKQ